MNEPIIITEVVGRAVQGMTKPFFCKSGFFDYYVKGAYAGLDSLCCEWVANRLVNRALPSFRRNGCTWMATRVCLCNWT